MANVLNREQPTRCCLIQITVVHLVLWMASERTATRRLEPRGRTRRFSLGLPASPHEMYGCFNRGIAARKPLLSTGITIRHPAIASPPTAEFASDLAISVLASPADGLCAGRSNEDRSRRVYSDSFGPGRMIISASLMNPSNSASLFFAFFAESFTLPNNSVAFCFASSWK